MTSADYSYSSSGGNDGGNYSSGCCTTKKKGSGSTMVSADYTYPATTYTTPSYTPVYTYTGGGCTSNCYPNPQPKPAPTCTISLNKTSIVRGEAVTITWNSTNAQYSNISNLGTSLPPSGSYTLYPTQNTTFSGTFYGNGKTGNCVANIVVTEPQPEPTCSLNANPSSINQGQSVTITWNSTNASYGNINNVGNNLAPSGSYTVYPTQNTTYTGTFYSNSGKQVTCSTNVVVTVQQCPAGYTGTYPNCVPPPVYNAPSCTITVSNYNYNNQYNYNQPVTISWTSNNAQYGFISQGVGSVSLSGSRTVNPTQTTTYVGTFTGYNGQTVTCSATVYVNVYPPVQPPVYPNTPYVTLSAVPYTGLELGPVGTALYWAFLAFWCALAAYLIVVKKVQNQVYASLTNFLFGSRESHTVASHAAHTASVVHNEDRTDDFIMAQINRVRA